MLDNEVLTERFYKFEDYILDLDQKLLFRNNKMIPLGQKSFECLLLLVQNSKRVVLKEDFFEKIWENSFVEDGVLAVNISYLRKIFSEENNKHKFIETLPRRGYRFTAEVTIVKEKPLELTYEKTEDDIFSEKSNGYFEYPEPYSSSEAKSFELNLNETQESLNENNTSENEQKWTETLLKNHFLRFGVLFLLFSIASFLIYRSYVSTYYPTNLKKISIVIFPFENIDGNKELDYLSVSLAENLNYSLSSLQNTKVVPTANIKKFINQSYNPIDEGKVLGVENIVNGTFHTEKDKISVILNITSISNEKPVIYQQTFEAPLNNLTSLRSSIFRFLSISLNLTQTDSELLKLQQMQTQNPESYEYYLKGSDAFLNLNFDRAIMYFEKSIDLDPNFLIALERLATVYHNKGNLGGCGRECNEKGIEYYKKILQIDPQFHFAKLRLSLAYIELNQIEKGVDLVKEVLAADKDNKYAYFCLSYAYRYAGLLDESIKMIKINRTLSGEDNNTTNIVTTYIYQQEYERFLAENYYSVNNSYGLFYKGLAYYYQGNFSEAKTNFDTAYQLSPDFIASKLGKVLSYHINKEDDKALSLLNSIREEVLKIQVNDGEVIYKIAQGYAILNKPKEALELFNMSVDKGFFCFPYFSHDSLLENIRKESEFENIMQKAKTRHEEFKQKYSQI